MGAEGFPAHAGMDPSQPGSGSPPCRLPRTRGDGPGTSPNLQGLLEASPHTRGWTPAARPRPAAGAGFPAHAGMDRNEPGSGSRTGRLPRTRGDGPACGAGPAGATSASPHTRGWTPVRLRGREHRQGFPAHAGMDRLHLADSPPALGLPRTRGDGPQVGTYAQYVPAASPHTRGWTRWWSCRCLSPRGFPAHAGMDPASDPPDRDRRGLPRTRGDGPCSGSAPVTHPQASPHTRGWTVLGVSIDWLAGGFPAHAGMDPEPGRRRRGRTRLPRTRGDGPLAGIPADRVLRASPHTRGWTLSRPRRSQPCQGFPAHAGMDPAGRPRGVAAEGLPRTRGDGPWRRRSTPRSSAASPHTRGWTVLDAARLPVQLGFPAHAGMDRGKVPLW